MSEQDYTYEVETLNIGILNQMPVRSVRMPREQFVALVEHTLTDRGYSDAVRDEVMPVARQMPRFPLGSWLDRDRGCGCVVGEYLVATGEIARAELARRINDDDSTVRVLLRDNPDGPALEDFGYSIDAAVKNEVYDHLPLGVYVDSVEIGS